MLKYYIIVKPKEIIKEEKKRRKKECTLKNYLQENKGRRKCENW